MSNVNRQLLHLNMNTHDVGENAIFPELAVARTDSLEEAIIKLERLK